MKDGKKAEGKEGEMICPIENKEKECDSLDNVFRKFVQLDELNYDNTKKEAVRVIIECCLKAIEHIGRNKELTSEQMYMQVIERLCEIRDFGYEKES